VMSMPMIAKSPDSSSKMSGQLQSATVRAPFACGSGPSLRRNIFDYYYSNLCCQPFVLLAVMRGKEQLPRIGVHPCCPHSERRTGAAWHVHDSLGGNVRVVTRHDQSGGT